MVSNLHTILLITVMAVITAALRFIPFFVFGNGKKTPDIIVYLGKILPYAVIGMLVVFCLKGVTPFQYPHGIPELIACAVVVGLHIWKRNTLLSIIGGTACYMVLIQLVF